MSKRKLRIEKLRLRPSPAEKLEALGADIALAREQVRHGELLQTSAEAFLARKRDG